MSTILTNFIVSAAKHSMPVRFLWRVIKDYDIEFKSEWGLGKDNVSQWLNELRLYRSTWERLQKGSDLRVPLAAPEAVSTFYHEATHAVMDLDDAGALDWFIRAQLYYSRAKLTNGNDVSDTETVVDEVAGAYVGHRAKTVWNAWRRLYLYTSYLHEVLDGTMSVNAAKIGMDGVPIAVEYDNEMQKRDFGYEPDGDKQVQVEKNIYPELLPYCDGTVLENRIFSHFHQMTHLRQAYNYLYKSMSKFPQLAKALGGPTGYTR
jgi:hypothetical protein